jgi:hypothetical protein
MARGFTRTALSLESHRLDAFERQLEAHISRTHHLNFTGPLQTALQRLVSSASALEFLSLSHETFQFPRHKAVIPVNLFNYTASSLMSCDIS